MEHRDPNLSQAYRDAPHPEPSSALDARILNAARQAVAKPAVRRRPTWFAWAIPFSSVAVLVLGVTLLLDMQQRAPEVLESPTAPPPDIRLNIPRSSACQVVKPAPVEIPAEPGESPRRTTSQSNRAARGWPYAPGPGGTAAAKLACKLLGEPGRSGYAGSSSPTLPAQPGDRGHPGRPPRPRPMP
ncbi:MAG: hypothetical protein IPG66_16225 [Hydrogenophilales bacterium]|nr:hypothetical protein [Hydrogenophilales bacterium]